MINFSTKQRHAYSEHAANASHSTTSTAADEQGPAVEEEKDCRAAARVIVWVLHSGWAGSGRRKTPEQKAAKKAAAAAAQRERPQMKLKRRGRFSSFLSSYVNLACLGEYKRDQ